MKKSEVNIDLPTEALCTCHFDHEKMMLVIVNLFSNAIEASAADENISVSLQEDSEKISIEISDRGTGIPENIKENILTVCNRQAKRDWAWIANLQENC